MENSPNPIEKIFVQRFAKDYSKFDFQARFMPTVQNSVADINPLRLRRLLAPAKSDNAALLANKKYNELRAVRGCALHCALSLFSLQRPRAVWFRFRSVISTIAVKKMTEGRRMAFDVSRLPILDVSVFLDRADVKRKLNFGVETTGKFVVVIERMTVALDENSIRVEGDETAMITEVTIKRKSGTEVSKEASTFIFFHLWPFIA